MFNTLAQNIVRSMIRKYFGIDPILNMTSVIAATDNTAVNHIISLAMYAIFKSWCLKKSNVYNLFQTDLKLCILCESHINKTTAAVKWRNLYVDHKDSNL